MKKLLFLFIILISLCVPCYGQDQIVNGRNSNITFDTSLTWNNLASRTYVLAPLGPDYGFCISVINNNTTSSHSFNVFAFQSGDLNVADYTHNTGRYAPLTISGSPSPVAANTTVTFFIRSNGASKLAFQFTGGSTQAGSPDTVDIYGVQTTANACGPVPVINAGYSTPSADLVVSDYNGQSFVALGFFLNPVINENILTITNTNGALVRKLYFKSVTISCSAACQMGITIVSNAGTTCSNPGIVSKSVPGTNTASTPTGNCTTLPAIVGDFHNLFLSANTPYTLNLDGFLISTGVTRGIECRMIAALAAGTATCEIEWYEK